MADMHFCKASLLVCMDGTFLLIKETCKVMSEWKAELEGEKGTVYSIQYRRVRVKWVTGWFAGRLFQYVLSNVEVEVNYGVKELNYWVIHVMKGWVINYFPKKKPKCIFHDVSFILSTFYNNEVWFKMHLMPFQRGMLWLTEKTR